MGVTAVRIALRSCLLSNLRPNEATIALVAALIVLRSCLLSCLFPRTRRPNLRPVLRLLLPSLHPTLGWIRRQK